MRRNRRRAGSCGRGRTVIARGGSFFDRAMLALMAVGDLFEAAEVHDLNEVRTARRAAVDPGGGDKGKDGC